MIYYDHEFNMRYFSYDDVLKILQISDGTLKSIIYRLKLVKPFLFLNQRFFSFKQLIHLKIIKKLKNEFKIKFSEIERVKNCLIKIIENNDLDELRDNFLVFDYANIYLIKKGSNQAKIKVYELNNSNENVFFKMFLLEEIIEELEFKTKLNIELYREKRSLISC